MFYRISPPLSIMIVEDEGDLFYLYKLYLATLGIDSIIFANALEALDRYQNSHGRYALALLD